MIRLAFLKSFKREKVDCARCQKPLGFSKNDPDPTWGFDGKICDNCLKYIRNGIAVYKVQYLEGHSKLPSKTEGLLAVYLFDRQYRTIFTTKNRDFRTEILTDDFLDYQTVVMNEKSTTRQFLTVGLSSSKSKEYLKIQFKDIQTDKVESLILEIDYSLETVRKNLDPILVTANNRRKETMQTTEQPPIVNCRKCDSKNKLENSFCSNCGERLQMAEQIIDSNTNPAQRDYVLYKGEKSQEEIDAEELARRLKNPDAVFNVKYLGGHKGFPTKKARDARIGIFIDRIEVQTDKFKVVIPFLRMTNIENMDEKRITTKRWFWVGAWAIAWKKKYVYTVIEYDDEHDSLGLIFDFEKHLESMQGAIYQRMIDFRSKKSGKFDGFYQ